MNKKINLCKVSLILIYFISYFNVIIKNKNIDLILINHFLLIILCYLHYYLLLLYFTLRIFYSIYIVYIYTLKFYKLFINNFY